MARFVVTGTPRTATGYASLFFRELAIPCTHERVFRPRASLADVLEWYTHKDHGESSWLAWAFLGLLPGPVPVLHQTRNPWQVVDSLAFRNYMIPKKARVDRSQKQYRDAVIAYCPEMSKYEDPVNRATAFVLAWNKHIVAAAAQYECPYMRYRIEDMGAHQVKAILEFLDEYRDSYEIDNAIANVPRNVNEGKQLLYDVEVVHPELREIVKGILPDGSPVLKELLAPATPRSAEELERQMDPRLRDALSALADECGYSREQVADVSASQGVTNHDIRK